jgi:hypothetical protein
MIKKIKLYIICWWKRHIVDEYPTELVDEDSILNSYPLDKIK